MELGLSGLASGFDWRSLVDQLVEVERMPQRRLLIEQQGIQERINAYESIKTDMSVLNSRLESLQDPELFNRRLASVSDETVAKATAGTETPLGSYRFDVTQLATASVHQGTANAGAAIHDSNDVSDLVIGEAGFATSVTAGTFSVNGRQISLETSDTLQAVFDKINSATGGAVTGSYDAGNDQITLSSSSEIVLGSTTDSSNFLQVAKLNNNGSGTITSDFALGSIQYNETVANANFATAVTDGGQGEGAFKINGVTIQYSATGDTVGDIVKRINNSEAGVTASYDPVNDRFQLTNKTTGDLGIGMEDVTGNFLAASGLAGGDLNRGQNLLYKLNGGSQVLSNPSNTIDSGSSGIPGLSVTALKEGTATVEVKSDTGKVKETINDFIKQYNKVQSLIDTQTASTTDADGKVTAGVLAGQRDAQEIASELRDLAYRNVAGLSGSIQHLSDLGISTNGQDNKLTVTDEAKLDEALANNLSGVKALFTQESTGVANQLAQFVDRTIGDDGTLVTRNENLTKQTSDIDDQVADLERSVQTHRQQLIDSFVSMETAQSRIDQQLQFLQQRFGG